MNLKEQINKLLLEVGSKHISRSLTAKNNKTLLSELKKETEFLGDTKMITENVYCIINGINKKPICPKCNSNYLTFKGFGKGYTSYCSVSCSRRSSKTKEKQKETNKKRYGVEYASQSKMIQKKVANTHIKKHGHKSNFQTPEFKEYVKQINIEKYGVESHTQTEEYKEKTKERMNDKYGVDYFFQTDQFKKKKIETNIERYGVKDAENRPEANKKREQTNILKYGHRSPLGNKEIQEKIKKNNLEKYGFISALSNKNIQEKIKQTNLKRYGVISTLSNTDTQNKIKQTNIDKYGFENPGNFKLIVDNLNKYNELGIKYGFKLELNNEKIGYNLFCSKCNNEIFLTGEMIYNRLIRYNLTPCTICHPLHSSISGIEKEFKEFLEKIYDGEIIQSNRTILNGKEIDILLADINIGIEINGLYWHSDINKEDKNYHFNKTELAKEKGIQLLHFFDDEITQGMELMYSLIAGKGKLKKDIDIDVLNSKYKLHLYTPRKIYGRKIKLIKLNSGKRGEKREYKKILEKHHIQGSDNARYYYGLELEDGTVLSIMTFKKMSVDKNQIKNNDTLTYELSRYVTIPGMQIIGGFKKLLTAFKQDINNEFPNRQIQLLTYSNLRYSKEEDNVYLRNGFNKIGFTGINYYYFFEGKKYHRFNFRKDNLYNKLLPERGIAVNPDYKQESERGMVQKLNDNGFNINKIFDCGHLKWELNL